MSNMFHTVFQVPVEGPSVVEVLDLVSRATQPQWIVTLNPEMLVAAYHQASYKATLQQADLHTVDGFGLWAVLRFSGRKGIHRLTGVDLSERLLAFAEVQGWKVGCFGGRPGTGNLLKNYFHTQYPRLSFLVEEGGNIDEAGNQDEVSEEALHRLTLFSPEMMLVALGGEGQGRKSGSKAHESFSRLRAILGVGGT